MLFADGRVWLCGQSLKDAARKKPTYVVEHDEPLMRRIYAAVKLFSSNRIFQLPSYKGGVSVK